MSWKEFLLIDITIMTQAAVVSGYICIMNHKHKVSFVEPKESLPKNDFVVESNPF